MLWRQQIYNFPQNSPISLMIFKIFNFFSSSTPSWSRKFSTIFSSDGSLDDKAVSQKKTKEQNCEQEEKE